MSPAYAELHCLSAFSFQRGAAQPGALVERAHALGYTALALTDECSLAGVVRAFEAAQRLDMRLIIGSEIRLVDGPRVVLLAPDHAGYGDLCRLITRGRRATAKGSYRLTRDDLAAHAGRLLALWVPDEAHAGDADVRWLKGLFGDRLWLALHQFRDGLDAGRRARVQRLARAHALPITAAGGALMDVRGKRALADVMTALRLRKPLAGCGAALAANGEAHLRARDDLATLFEADWLAESARIAACCAFRLCDLRYTYPHELVPDGMTASAHLRALTEAGLRKHWPEGEPPGVRALIERELAIIGELEYEHFFLTVADLVRFARARNILCQGRGSAANSVVCYALGITAVDPSETSMLFERFVSKERDEPPDIDVDFEHQRREEVIQYVYDKYGRERAALAATVICYRTKSALRDAGFALGIAPELVDRLGKAMHWHDRAETVADRLQGLGVDPARPDMARWLAVTEQLVDLPRHLSQHVGGFVIADQPLHHLVPVENAAMADRTIIQWDKDDLEALGLLKVDVLALGMLTAIRKTLDLVAQRRGQPFALTDIPKADPATYAMIQRGETVGVFQIESRAQMSMLPRLRPASYYDLVIQISIVRPGPIQGGMVHPYLRRRQGLETVTYPSAALERVLGRTLGVPLFQEQVMQIAIVAAGFSPGEADQVRRSMAAWKRHGGLEHFRDRLMAGMRDNGYDEAFAEAIYQQILGFGSYGFPESHAASFALLAYASAWLKRHHPAAFFAALLNSQPMGFYGPAQLVAEARRGSVTVRPVDIVASDWDCTLEDAGAQPALRLGMRLVKGLSEAAARRIVTARAGGAFVDTADLVHRAGLDARDREALARADALATIAGHRHQAHWQAAGLQRLPGLLAGHGAPEAPPALPPPAEGEEILGDYNNTGLSLRRHPVALLRSRLDRMGVCRAGRVAQLGDGCALRVAGLLINRQRPGTARGTVFMTLEDEDASYNLIVWGETFRRFRAQAMADFVIVRGMLQRADGVTHIVVHHIEDRADWLGALSVRSRDFH
ncbi:error-prone DNA polymerase [Algiphilus sp.]|uniref:error-prone DNA polymerase n=1 Tax=Algiphilus sp. TaxID=1872431 RepID=UPI0025C61518|nr:error-prone DNA polymerase [Algiphilus sp.]MCK5771580.1 error-prone DNA polymerase [Algiphilus sp.]